MEVREEFFSADVERELQVDEGGELFDQHGLLGHAQHAGDARLAQAQQRQPASHSGQGHAWGCQWSAAFLCPPQFEWGERKGGVGSGVGGEETRS